MAHYGWQNYNVGQLQPERAAGSGAGARAPPAAMSQRIIWTIDKGKTKKRRASINCITVYEPLEVLLLGCFLFAKKSD